MSLSLNTIKVGRALSAFDHASRRWAAIPLRDPHTRDPHDTITITQRPSARLANACTVGKQTLSLTSWNIQASQSRPVARSELILDPSSKYPTFPTLSFSKKSRLPSGNLSSATPSKRFGSPLLAKEEEKGGGGSKMVLDIDSVFRTKLPSRYERDALCVNIVTPAAPRQVFRLFNVHLDSLDSQFRRALQMMVLAGLLREPGCSGGIIAGDFNAILTDDHALVDKHELVDAWVALHGGMTGPDGGATWGVGVDLEHGLKPGRLDKVLMLGSQPNEIEVLQPGLIDAYTPWSDHCGLRCTFTI